MLTKAAIEDAKPPTKGRRVLWDNDPPGSGLAGFGCRVFASGQRSFIAQYRLPGSRKKQTATIGTYGLITLPQARDKAEKILAKVKLGDDPQAERKARTAAEIARSRALTVRELVRQYSAALRAGTAKTNRSNGHPQAEAYVADTVLHLDRFGDRYGKQTAAAITRSEVVSLLNEYIEQPSAHRRMHGAINRMYAWARQMELVANNPTADIVTTQGQSRERVLSLAELAAIWRATDQLSPLYRDLIRLMILTGQRRGEVARMIWGEIDLTSSLWTLPSSRTKARRQHVIPLPETAVAVLRARREALKRSPRADDLVLPSVSRDGKDAAPVSGWGWLKRELDSRIKLQSWRMHDFRRSLVTHLAEKGADEAVLDVMLNHAASVSRSGVIGVYQKARLIEPMRKVMALWDEMLRNAFGQDNVIRLNRDASV